MSMNMSQLIQGFVSLFKSIRQDTRYWLSVILLIVGQLFVAPMACADEILEHRVKTAFIYNFIAFTQWSENTAPVINLCLYGENDFGQEIDTLQDRTLGRYSINLNHVSDSNQLKHCQVIFFSKATANDMAGILNSLENRPILTLADHPQAIAHGVMINMSLAQGKVVFEINWGIARKNGLDLSSKLLQLAVKVHR